MKVVINVCFGGFGISQAAQEFILARGGTPPSWSDGDDRRADPLLVEAVESLGSEAASGAYAKLQVVEIPDGVVFTIEEYDGNEHVAEAHRTWR